MKYSSIPILIIILSVHSPIAESADFKTRICSNNKFLKCVGVNKEKCEDSFEKSETICTKKYPIDVDADNNKQYDLAKKFGECSTSEFINGINITENIFEGCSVHLKPAFTEYRNNAIKERKSNQEELRKLEESEYK